MRVWVAAIAGILLISSCSVFDEDSANQSPGGNTDSGQCVELVPLWSSSAPPAAVSMRYQARDCDTGAPRDALDNNDFQILEDGMPLGSDAELHRISSQRIRPYVLLSIDQSTWAAESADEVRASTRAMVDHLLVDDPIPGLHIGIATFNDPLDGDSEYTIPTRDIDDLYDHIDRLFQSESLLAAPDTPYLDAPFSTGIERLQNHQQQVYERNHGGLIPAGHLIVISPGDTVDASDTNNSQADAANRVQSARASHGASSPPVQSWAVGFADEGAQALEEIVGGQFWMRASEPQQLEATLQSVATDIRAEIDSRLRFGYCSEARDGTARLTINAPDQGSNTIEFTVDAQHFEAGCDAAFIDQGCDALECGGFHCGACSDTTRICDGKYSGQCIYYCLDQVVCDDEDIVTDLGHEMNCFMGPTVMECADQCVDVSVDENHCGDCGTQCLAPGSECVDGVCLCDDNRRACGADCVDITTDTDHCGDCENNCPPGVECVGGSCDCEGDLVGCSGACVDISSDTDHCGGCNIGCGGFHACDDGQCTCDEGYGYCDDECVDIFANENHCGGCGNQCDSDQYCDEATCLCDADNEAICGGGCTDVMANDDHCGECDNECGEGRFCDDGQCICDGSQTLCDDSCVDLTDDTEHCGECGHGCPNGIDCIDGVCDCGDTLTACDEQCVDTAAHPDHCDGCGQACGTDEICENGSCEVAPVIDEKQVSAGQEHSCGLEFDGTAVCWGLDDDGQSSPPSTAFTHISAGHRYTCGVRADGLGQCWGRNLSGESLPPPALTFVQIDAATNHTCGVTTDGDVECWGSDQHGKASPPTGEFLQVAVAQNHSCGLRTSGAISCWGEDDEIQNSKSDPPSGIFVAVDAGLHHSCGLDDDGHVVCWGENSAGQLDAPEGEFTAISAGGAHSCGIDAQSELQCWGSNNAEQLDVPAGSFYALSAGFLHGCAVGDDELFRCWGQDDDGQSSP